MLDVRSDGRRPGFWTNRKLDAHEGLLPVHEVDDGAVGEDSGRGIWIKLPGEIAVLFKAAIAVIRPQPMDCPAALREQLSLLLQASPRRPDLCL